jgi:prephenate dehydratase
LKAIEGADTAESAKLIREKGLVGQAAIASRLAADAYGLEILEAGIETNDRNYTRFLAIVRGDDYLPPKAANKASIRFELSSRPGSLARVLEAFGRRSVNLTKIQSIPILGRPYEYSFHVDLEWESRSGYHEAMGAVASDVIRLIHFGEYVRSERPTA